MSTKETFAWLDQADKTGVRMSYYERLNEYFQADPKSPIEKLVDFPKFVPNNMLARFLARYEIFKHCLDVHGVIVECGVFSGSGVMTFAQISSILEPYNQTRTIYGFDTFEGFPHVAEQDLGGKSSNLRVGGLAEESDAGIERCAAIHEDFRLLNRQRQVRLIKGDICNTVPRFLEENPFAVVSLLSLDCDLYAPTKTALEHFLPRMPKGAVVMFDELCMAEYPGETLALIETIGVRNVRLKRLPFTKISYAILD